MDDRQWTYTGRVLPVYCNGNAAEEEGSREVDYISIYTCSYSMTVPQGRVVQVTQDLEREENG